VTNAPQTLETSKKSTTRSLAINEIFLSVQGESTHAGRVCAFVRLMGCPLRCTYCDTEYAFHEGKRKFFDEIFAVLKSYDTKLVEVTGGEPLAQPNTVPFLSELAAKGYEVLLETSGAYSILELPPEVKVILDVKTPGSGESARQFWDNLGALKAGRDEVKFVVTSRDDFDYAVDVAERYRLFERGITTLVSPAHPVAGKEGAAGAGLTPRELAEWVVASRRDFRYQVQLHKYIWGAEVRGV
jgi:7-carboxy-7-deazaguanine synthase